MEMEEDSGEFPLPKFVMSLVEEIGEDASLGRKEWEQVAGGKFMDRVVEPRMVWQVQYLPALAFVLAALFNCCWFLLVKYLGRWMESQGPRPGKTA